MELISLALLGMLFLTVTVFYIRKILYMIIDKEITPVQSLFYMGAYFLCLVLFFTLNNNFIRIVFIVLIGGFNFLYEPIVKYINERNNNNFYLRKILKYDEVLLFNPYDWGTLSQKAYCYFKMQDYEKAILIQKQVVDMSHNDLSEVEKLNSYKKYLQKLEQQMNDVRCWFCGVMVPKGVDKCYNCGHSMNFAENIIIWLKNGGAKKIIVYVMSIVVIIMLYNFMLSFLSENLRFLIHLITIVIIFACIIYSIYSKD